jgi:hypothetical protein
VRHLVWGMLVCLLACSGCATLRGLDDQLRYNDGTYQFGSRLQNYCRAFCVWHLRAAHFRGEPHRHDFAAGFRQGYCDVASGEDGCLPPLAPREYWNCSFENPEGQGRITAWFAGYSHGAAAAEEEAAGVFRPVRVSATIQRRHELDRAPRRGADRERWEAVPPGVAEPDPDLLPESEPAEEPAEPNPDEQSQSPEAEAPSGAAEPVTAFESPAPGLN